MEKMKSYLAAINGVTGITLSLQEAETIGKLIILSLTGVSILIPLLWACSDRRRKRRQENGETIITDAMLEILQAMTPAELDTIHAKYLGHHSRIMQQLPLDTEAAREFATGARKLIHAAWVDRLAELQPGTVPPAPTVPTVQVRR